MRFPLQTTDMMFVQRTLLAISQIDDVGNITLDTTKDEILVEASASVLSLGAAAFASAIGDLHDEISGTMENIRELVFG